MEVNTFKDAVKEAYRLWRERNSDWPKIYPSISEWVFAPAVLEEALMGALEFDLLRGLDDHRESQTYTSSILRGIQSITRFSFTLLKQETTHLKSSVHPGSYLSII